MGQKMSGLDETLEMNEELLYGDLEIDKKSHADELPEKVHVCPFCGESNFIRDPRTNELICNNGDGYVVEDMRLRKWDNRTKINSAHDRNLTIAMSVLSTVGDKLNLSKPYRERAALIYRKTLKRNIIRGRSIEGIMTASIYAAGRLLNNKKTFEEIAAASTVDEKEISRNYRLLLKEKVFDKPPNDRSQQYLESVLAKLNIYNKEFTDFCYGLLNTNEKLRGSSGRDPLGLVAAAIYIGTKNFDDISRTQKVIAEECKVTEVTLRNRYKGMTKLLNKNGYDI